MAVGIPLLYGSDFSGADRARPRAAARRRAVRHRSVLSATINGRGLPGYSAAAVISTRDCPRPLRGLHPDAGDIGAAVASSLSYAINFAITAGYYHQATGDRVAPLLVPTREEVADLRGLVSPSQRARPPAA
ncbi:MAG: hypothetical protein R2736_21665 [Solirubrobacterales bacterium]